jgi:TPR repeat protein
VKWYTLAAEQGNADAQYNLGIMYEYGEGVPKDAKSAVKWYTLAAQQGQVESQYYLGAMYERGEGTPKDAKSAVKWYTLAAEQGQVEAQYNLGYLYQNGIGVLDNLKTAMIWYTKAAEQGYAKAQFRLGMLYELGEDSLKDYLRAYMWYNLSSYNGSERASESKVKLSKELTSADIIKAQDMSSRCLESDYADCGRASFEGTSGCAYNNIEECSDETVCHISVVTSNSGKKIWRTPPPLTGDPVNDGKSRLTGNYIAVAKKRGLSCGVDPSSLATTIETKVQKSEGPYIHPECLDFLGPWSKQNEKIIDCSGLDFSKVQEQGNEFGARYGEGKAAAYKYADVDLGFPIDVRLLEVGVSGGGSGLFSTIVLLNRSQKDKTKYEILVRTPSGDRCNDGNKWVSEASADGFIFKSAATPFRLLNPDDTKDWKHWYLGKALRDEASEELKQPIFFNEWEPYEDVTNSAMACFGWIVRKFDYETGFEIIGVELEKGLKPQLEKGSLESCVNNWLVSEAEKGSLRISKEDWLRRLESLKESCRLPLISAVTDATDFNKGQKAFELKDYESALAVWLPLAEQGDAKAQNGLGVMYSSYWISFKDEEKAVKWWALSAKQGYADAQNNLATRYDFGLGVPQDYETAIKWYTLAAEQGNTKAQYNLGDNYSRGHGVTQSHEVAVKWWALAGEKGHIDAMWDLSRAYSQGLGVSQNYKTAVKWYVKLAKRGEFGAQAWLGKMYENGTGIGKDDLRAYMWYHLSDWYNGSEEGSKSGQFSKEDLAKKLTSDQISKAEEMSSLCFNSNYTDC